MNFPLFHNGLSEVYTTPTLSAYPDATFDVVYIDADHGYAGCLTDLEVAFAKTKAGGVIAGHDYEMNMEKANTHYNFGVKRAVDEFCARHGLTIFAKANDGCVSFAIRR